MLETLKSSNWKPFFLLALLFSVGGCSTKRPADPGLATVLDDYFKRELPSDQPGGAVLVAKGDSVYYSHGYGLSDMVTREPITPKTLFNLGSISKTFVANAVLILRNQGKLSLEDSIILYFPNFKNKKLAKKVKIKHLLSHTSGLPDNRNVAGDTVFYLTAKDAENWYPVTQADRLNFEPGERFEYSNPAYNGLALIVEKVSGMKWQKFVAEQIFKPSDMINSTITDGPYPKKGVAHGYIKVRGEWKEDDYGEEPTFAAAGNGGVWSSVEELLKYEQAIERGIFLDSTSVTGSRTVFHPANWLDSIPPAVGWSWFIGQTDDGLKTVGHTGSQGGFLCNYVTVPEKKIRFFILCNTLADVDAFTQKVFDELKRENWLDQ